MNPFVVGLLVMNLGASVVFLFRGSYPWALVYFGAFLIQCGCLWMNLR